MKPIEYIETKYQDLKDSWVEWVNIMSELIKFNLLYLPLYIVALILGVIGFILFMYGLDFLGFWMIPLYIVLMFMGVVIYNRYFDKKNKK